MEKFSRSKTSRESVEQPSNMNGMRSYSTSANNIPNLDDNFKVKKVNFDPELLRKKRVAGYKAYEMEGKMKGSVRKSFKWIKDTCNQVIHGIR